MGENTTYKHFYKPALGASGSAELATYDAKIDRLDVFLQVDCANYDNPDDAITAINTDNKTLIVTEEETCDTNFTVPANVTVKFERGGKWTINNGVTVTFAGQFDAGLWQIFNCVGTGTVVLNTGSVEEVYPEWWGAKGDGTTDDAAIFNSVLTQLDSSTVKIMKLNNYSYLITDTIIIYQGQSIIGRNRYPSTLDQAGVNDYPVQTKIIFAPTSEKDLFDITTIGTDYYVTKVYLGGIHLYGNTTGGVTYSRYAINSRAAQSLFENLGIERFQDGIYCNFTMTNKYRDIYIGNCSHACIYTSTEQNTTDTFDNVIMRASPWGAILRYAVRFTFLNPLFESLTTGGVNIYKECAGNNFVSGYCEAVPNTSDDYGMFYINHDGTTLNAGNTSIIGGWYINVFAAKHGSFLDVDYTSSINEVSVIGSYFSSFTNGIKASANTAVYSIHLSGISSQNITNSFVDTATKLKAFFVTDSAGLAGVISDETGSGALVFGTSPTLSNPKVRTTFETLLDDAAQSFTPTAQIGILYIYNQNLSDVDTTTEPIAIINYDTMGAVGIASLYKTSNVALATGTLAGTTGTDGKFTISVHTDGKIYLENRLGGTRYLGYWTFGATA